MLRQRVVTALVAVSVLMLVLFLVPEVMAEIFIALLVLAGAWEWSGFLGTRSLPARAAFVFAVGLLMALVGLKLAAFAPAVFVVSLTWWVGALIWTFFYPTPVPPLVRWLGGVLVLIPLHVALLTLYRAEPTVLLFVLLIVWAADIGAYFVGKRFGRVKLAPQISPGKTWEGVIGGLLAVTLLTVGRSFLVDTDLAVLVPFCLAIACASIVGDLTVSMFKRNAGLKDSGALFPGHGGVLDRIDSVSAAAPLFALGVTWAGLR